MPPLKTYIFREIRNTKFLVGALTAAQRPSKVWNWKMDFFFFSLRLERIILISIHVLSIHIFLCTFQIWVQIWDNSEGLFFSLFSPFCSFFTVTCKKSDKKLKFISFLWAEPGRDPAPPPLGNFRDIWEPKIVGRKWA